MYSINKNNIEECNDIYKQDGYVVLKNFINPNQVKYIKKKLLLFLKKYSKKMKQRQINYIKNTKQINSIHNIKNWNLLKKLQSSNKIKNLAKIFLNENVKNFGAEIFAKPPRIGLASPVHQDNFYWNIKGKGLTIWIALDESNRKNGAVFYYRKSQKLGLLKHELSMVPGSSQKIKNIKTLNNFKMDMPKLKPGDALVHDFLIAHGSKKNTSNKSRAGLTMRFIGKKSKVNYLSKKIYEKKLKKQIKYLSKNARLRVN